VIPLLAAPATDGEDRPNCDVAVDVRRTINGVETNHIRPGGTVAVEVKRRFHLLRDHRADEASLFERIHEDVVRPHVELFNLLALDVHLSGVAQHANQRRAVQLARNQLRGEANMQQERSEIASR
jgi:hypothetical protein